MRRIAHVLVMTVGISAAEADPVPPDHQGQLGLSVRLGDSVRGIAPYHSEYCGSDQGSTSSGDGAVCTGRAPLFLDLEPSYGVSRSVEVVLGIHLGLESDFGSSAAMAGPHALVLDPGVRVFFSESGHSKLFVEPTLALDFTGYQKPNGDSYGTDFGVRALEGYWLDLHRAFGFYAFVGETAEFARWLSFGFEFGVGFQGRYP